MNQEYARDKRDIAEFQRRISEHNPMMSPEEQEKACERHLVRKTLQWEREHLEERIRDSPLRDQAAAWKDYQLRCKERELYDQNYFKERIRKMKPWDQERAYEEYEKAKEERSTKKKREQDNRQFWTDYNNALNFAHSTLQTAAAGMASPRSTSNAVLLGAVVGAASHSQQPSSQLTLTGIPFAARKLWQAAKTGGTLGSQLLPAVQEAGWIAGFAAGALYPSVYARILRYWRRLLDREQTERPIVEDANSVGKSYSSYTPISRRLRGQVGF